MWIVTRWDGDEEENLPEPQFAVVIAQLVAQGGPRAWVSLRHESEWTLRYGRDRRLVLERATDDFIGPRHLRDVRADEAVEAWTHLARGDLRWLELALPWRRGAS